MDCAGTWEEVPERAEQDRFDMVVLDLAMPGIDGIETLKRPLERTPDLQVVLLTGRATIKAGVEAARLGAVDVPEKPTDIDTIIEKIEQARARREP